MARKQTEIVTVNVDGTDVPARLCSKCDTVLPLSAYHKGKANGGTSTYCVECTNNYMREYYAKNRTKLQSVSRQFYKENREKVRESKRKWRVSNPSKSAEGTTRYYHLKKSTPNTLTKDQYEWILKDFGGCCALTGESADIHLDHWIAVSTQFAGTCYGNVYPLSKALNSSKRDENPFVWIQRRPDVNADKFAALVKYLADQNGMTIEAFRDYTFRCYSAKVSDSG